MTLTLTGWAPIIRATIASLKAGLPAQVAVFNADPANQVQIDVPQAYVFGAEDVKTVFPLVEVAIRDGVMDIVDIAGGMDSDPELIVILWQEGDRGELSETYEASIGLAKCALEVLLADGAFGATVHRIDSRDGARCAQSARALPGDLAADLRTFTKWHVACELRFLLPAVDGLH